MYPTQLPPEHIGNEHVIHSTSSVDLVDTTTSTENKSFEITVVSATTETLGCATTEILISFVGLVVVALATNANDIEIKNANRIFFMFEKF